MQHRAAVVLVLALGLVAGPVDLPANPVLDLPQPLVDSQMGVVGALRNPRATDNWKGNARLWSADLPVQYVLFGEASAGDTLAFVWPVLDTTSVADSLTVVFGRPAGEMRLWLLDRRDDGRMRQRADFPMETQDELRDGLQRIEETNSLVRGNPRTELIAGFLLERLQELGGAGDVE